MDDIYGWLLSCTNVLANSFGTKWNTQWAQAGFTNLSTGVPSRQADRLGLTLSLVNFFTANPSYEVPSQNVTAAQGTTLRTAALTAQAAVNAATATLTALGVTWQSAYDALVKLMTELLKNLEAKLAKDDPRWLHFGLQMPATVTTPGQPQNLSAHVDQTGAIIVQCDPVPTATRYRWRTLLAGIQINYQLAASTPGPMGSLSGFAPGQAVQIIAQAVNQGLQGVASDPILFTVPQIVAVEKRAQAPSTANTVNALVSSNGNGNGRRNHSAHSHAAAGELHPRMA